MTVIQQTLSGSYHGSIMTSHANAGYKQYYDGPADQELKLGGEGEVSLQLDLYCNKVNIKCSGSTKRRK